MLTLAALAAQPNTPGGRVEVQGHRGARAVRPENTLPAFEYALEVGVDTLELDLAVTRDDHLVVSHDPIIDERICSGGSGAIRRKTLSEIRKLDCGSKVNPRFRKQRRAPGARMPTLDEVFRHVRRSKAPAAKRVQFNIETKIFPARPELSPGPSAFARLVVDAIERHGMTSRAVVQSFDHRSLRAVKRIAPSIRVAMLTSESLPDFAALARSLGAEIVSPNWAWITREAVDELHAAGVRVIPWTVNDLRVVDRMLMLDVDGIITDDPKRVIEHLRRRGRR